MEAPELRTDERRALALMAAEDLWLGAQPAVAGRRARAWVQLSKYRGDEIPVGWDVFVRLEQASFLTPGRRVRGDARQYRLSEAGRAAWGGDSRTPPRVTSTEAPLRSSRPATG